MLENLTADELARLGVVLERLAACETINGFLFGETIPELLDHLERQFEPGMTLDNIHIDHRCFLRAGNTHSL